MNLKIPYYRGSIELGTEGLNVRAILEPTYARSEKADADHVVRNALLHPVGTSRLRDLARDKARVVVVTSDHTRPMPSRITLPALLTEIRAGNPRAQITILVATGLHRPTTEQELRQMFGESIVDNEEIVVHQADKTEDCIELGLLPSGNPFAVNRRALEADLLICEGFIEPHFFAGFSGGRKSILPGICSADTIKAFHSARMIAHPRTKVGMLDGNIVHADAVYAARRVNVGLVLNVALNPDKELVAAFAGDLEQAHLLGCDHVAGQQRVPGVMADIVITSNGGYPLDQNLYQCSKAISTAAQCANAGGVIIMVASCTDGIGGMGFERLMLMGNAKSTLELIHSLTVSETIPEQWCAQVLLDIMLQHTLILVTNHLSHDVVKRMGIVPASTIGEALCTALRLKGADAGIAIIPDGVSTIVSW